MSQQIEEIGELLRYYREKKKYSIITTANFVGISDKWLSDVERGARPPPRYDLLLNLGMYLGISEKELMWSAAKFYQNRRKKKKLEKAKTN
jgi:transcriptional regulator with XRE-family HTH domain